MAGELMTAWRWLRGTFLVTAGTWLWLLCLQYTSAQMEGWVLSAVGGIIFYEGARTLFQGP